MATKFENIYTQIKLEIDQLKIQYGYSNDSTAFGHFMIKMIFDIADDEANESITDGFDDNGIDAIYIEHRNTKSIVHFFQFKFPESVQKINSNSLKQPEILKLINGYDYFISNDDKFNSIIWNDLIKEKREQFIGLDNTDNSFLHIVRYTTNTNNSKNLAFFDSNVKSLHDKTGNTINYDCYFASEITNIYEKARLNELNPI